MLCYKWKNCLGGEYIVVEFCREEKSWLGSKHLEFIVFLPPFKKAVPDMGQNVAPVFSVMKIVLPMFATLIYGINNFISL